MPQVCVMFKENLGGRSSGGHCRERWPDAISTGKPVFLAILSSAHRLEPPMCARPRAS